MKKNRFAGMARIATVMMLAVLVVGIVPGTAMAATTHHHVATHTKGINPMGWFQFGWHNTRIDVTYSGGKHSATERPLGAKVLYFDPAPTWTPYGNHLTVVRMQPYVQVIDSTHVKVVSPARWTWSFIYKDVPFGGSVTCYSNVTFTPGYKYTSGFWAR